MPASVHKPHHAPPEAVDLRSPRAGLQAIATFEAIKGVFVLAAGFGLLALLHKDLPEVADHLIHRIHLTPRATCRTCSCGLPTAAPTASCGPWLEARSPTPWCASSKRYGLWNARVWAEWFAILSGCLYLPWEIYEVFAHRHWFRVLILLFNVPSSCISSTPACGHSGKASDGPEESPPPVAVRPGDVDPRMLE